MLDRYFENIISASAASAHLFSDTQKSGQREIGQSRQKSGFLKSRCDFMIFHQLLSWQLELSSYVLYMNFVITCKQITQSAGDRIDPKKSQIKNVLYSVSFPSMALLPDVLKCTKIDKPFW